MSSWPVPKDGPDAQRRWGKSGTFQLDISRCIVEKQVRITFEYPPRRRRGSWDDVQDLLQDERGWGRPSVTYNPAERVDPIGVRFSGHPEALLSLLRTLHIEYAKKLGQYGTGTKKSKRTIIFDMKGDE